MASLVKSLDGLKISDEKERKGMFGYVYRTKTSRNYFHCSQDYIVVPSFNEKKTDTVQTGEGKGIELICLF